MTTTPTVEPTAPVTDDNTLGGLVHTYCCDEALALCGKHFSPAARQMPDDYLGPDSCAVCEDLSAIGYANDACPPGCPNAT